MRLFSGATPIVVLAAAIGAGGTYSGGTYSIVPDIEVDHAIYADGFLTVSGQASKPDERISLDGRYSAKSDEHNQFRFHVQYLPKDCVITLTSPTDSRLAVVRGCDLLNAPAAAQPASGPAH